MSLYITLPSNSSSDYFPDNTNSHYFTHLEKRLRFDEGEWEVALADLSYQNTWNNITEGKLTVGDIITLGQEGDQITRGVTLEINISKGRVDSIPELIFRIQKTLREYSYEKKIVFHWDEFTNKCHIVVHKPVTLRYSDDIAHVLGLPPGIKVPTPGYGGKRQYQHGTNATDVKAGFHHIFIYSDVIKSRPVGHTSVPLLRTIPVRGTRYTTVYESFPTRQYMPVRDGDIENIEMRLTTDTGHDVNFHGGLISATLHFRKRL